MTPTVREAAVADAREVRRIACDSWREAYCGILEPEVMDETLDDWYDVDGLAESIARAGERDDAAFLVAEATDARDTGSEERDVALVGFAHAGAHHDEADAAHLARIYVRPEAWGDGAGTALLERAEADLAERYDRLRLTALADNEIGVSFYESRGFERVETRESDIGEGLEEYVYEKEL